MPLPIEDYALIGDCHTAALVGKDGSIDWLCFPRFDAGACFAALLGGPEHGRWLLAPLGPARRVTRRYSEDTLVLQTDIETDTGCVRLTDFMPYSDERWDLVRIVEGLRGSVALRLELIVRFDYGSIVPWVHRSEGGLLITAGPDTLELNGSIPVVGENMKTVANFSLNRGQRESFTLNYRPSHHAPRPPLDAAVALQETEAHWREWSSRLRHPGPRRAAVIRSLITLKALTYKPTGGIVAAPTTSLPEQLGGVRNWDYRFCWLRDATFTLNALLLAGYVKEATEWREWLIRAVAGSPDDIQILYSVDGARRLEEYSLEWLPGYQGSAPVRIGNAASKQFQLDVFGEVMDTLHLARMAGLDPETAAWNIQKELLVFLESAWQQPDDGIWEIRGPRRHFTHSKVMAWVAFDRGIKDAEQDGLDAPLERWKAVRDAIHAEVCTKGFDAAANTFIQSYGSRQLDASLLLIPQVGFLPPDDPRVHGTIAAIERDLLVDGLIVRYSTASGVDALPAGEGAFLPCSFWLADGYFLTGRRDEGERLLARLLGLCNDVGLLAEEYDPKARRMLGNFPQALTHMALVNSVRLAELPTREAVRASEQGERQGALADSSARP